MNKSQKSKPTSDADLAKAEELVLQVKQDGVRKCGEIIDAALREFDCILDAEVVYRRGQWRDRISVISRPENMPSMQHAFISEKSEE
ncbi:hypothetical protein LCGC14_0955790 [marine sediment metagenome]|uniref:Uncharacterized protein n=1 Tax=marine sediment metagenome TaxID=412755 RepID=A0A0F9QZ86_9ZZZZ|nr:hypothetical protein [Pricia sp.]